MALPTPPDPEPLAPRRLVLVDLDWQEADLVPELLRRPGVSVRLVAGDGEENAGVKVAALCGVPRTLELADLTREIFDLALVGEHSTRRALVERLLTALGTPIAAPAEWLAPAPPANGHGPHAAPHAAAPAHDLDEALDRALPDLAAPPAAEAPRTAPPPELPGPSPHPDWSVALERFCAATGASAAELRGGAGETLERLARVGAEDPLLVALIQISLAVDAPHVVSRLDGPDRGLAWGAWPFRTRHHRGVLAAARFEPVAGRAQWEEAMQGVRVAWERAEREHARAAAAPGGWLAPESFAQRLALAVERNQLEAVPCAVHRLRFEDAPECVDGFCEALPGRVRDGDALCRPGRREVLVLHLGPAAGFAPLRRRLVALWEEAWRSQGRPLPAPPIVEERVELQGREDAASFVAAAGRWLSPA